MPEHFDDWPWRQWAQRYPDAIALHGPQGELSWRQVARRLPTLDLAFGWSSENTAWPPGMAPLDVDVTLLLSSYPPAAEAQPLRPSLPPAHTPWDPQRLATLTLTSGSSGMPKAAAHRYAAHLCSAAGVVTLLDFQRAGCWLLSLPLYHASGQGIVWRWRGAAMLP